MFDYKPCVYLVGNDYQIIFNTTEPGLGWVEVQGERFYDEINGLFRSNSSVHRCIVPVSLLNETRSYTICFRSMAERKPYFPKAGTEERRSLPFKPFSVEEGVKIYHLSDTHSHVKEAVETGSFYQSKLDLLVMNGDIADYSDSQEDMMTIFQIAGELTRGQRPVIFSRGNHDNRGAYAEKLFDYIGTDHGNSFFTFKAGGIWGVVLDAGEDKLDDDAEYGGTVNFHAFRKRILKFLQRINENADEEYLSPDVKVRMAICHMPFCTTHLAHTKFDIEKEMYANWVAELNQMKLDLMLCGHTHDRQEIFPGDRRLRYDANFPVIIGSEFHMIPVDPKYGTLICTALNINTEEIRIRYTNNHHEVVQEGIVIPLKGSSNSSNESETV